VQLLRQAEGMDNMAALIFYVNSGGGSALASDLIGREITRLSRKKPVIVYMGSVAASGGYYVAASAQHIMSQETTITGSIGVITARAALQGLYEKMKVNRVSLKRGNHADLYSDPQPMDDQTKQIFWDGVQEYYRQFKQVVAAGRDIPHDDLEPLCEGRVWTGRQAQARGLVDSHGDFIDAIRLATELAELQLAENEEVRVANFYLRRDGYLLPKPQEAAEALSGWLSRERLLDLNGRALLLLPLEIKIY
jgi:protease-4